MRTVANGFATLALAGSVALAAPGLQRSRGVVEGATRSRVAAVAFDYFVLFNPDSIATTAEQVVPGRGREFTNLWRTRQFEYSWLRSITGRYVDFFRVTEDALVFTANAMQVALAADQKQQLLDAYLVSTDANRTFKPDPRAYQLGIDRLKLPKQAIVFAAFGGWDAAGAKSFGYPTVWVNRFNQPAEELGIRPDRTVLDMDGLVDVVLGNAAASY